MRREVALDGALLDRFTQRWVMATGRPVEFGGSDHWLDGPIGAPDGVDEDWIDQHASRKGAVLTEGDPQGLLPDFTALSGVGLDVGAVSPTIVDFYENTSEWSVDVWSRWSRWAEPGGRLINALFAHRLRQLSLPIDPLDVAYGMRDDGAYLIVRPDAGPQGWARRIPLPERFELFTDADGVLRCDHHLDLGRQEILQLHYRLQRAPSH